MFKSKEAKQESDQASRKEILKAVDKPTLFAAASVISQMGFKHYQISRDTRVQMEARKAHRFVAMNCEEGALKILQLSGEPDSTIESLLKEITRQVVEFNKPPEKETVTQ